MRRELRHAVEHEEYELAAELRDRISALEDDRRAARTAAFDTEESS
jgi:protein-arginine kinase activator protein McsA